MKLDMMRGGCCNEAKLIDFAVSKKYCCFVIRLLVCAIGEKEL